MLWRLIFPAAQYKKYCLFILKKCIIVLVKSKIYIFKENLMATYTFPEDFCGGAATSGPQSEGSFP